MSRAGGWIAGVVLSAGRGGRAGVRRPPSARTGAVALAAMLAACSNPSAPAPDAAAPAARQAGSVAPEVRPPAAVRIQAILAAEHRRVAVEVTAEDQQSRDVEVRRSAARALSRIGGEAARPGLLRALADEDDEVAAWGAYGIGFFCKKHEKESVSALVAHALARDDRGGAQVGAAGTIPAALAGPTTATTAAAAGSRGTATATAAAAGGSGAPARATAAPSRLDAMATIARAIGRCAAEESEPTLVAWLAGPRDRAVAAAFGLGDVGVVKQKLREETLVALLNLAAGNASMAPVPEALFAVGRLEHVPPTVVDRIREVATARLAEPGPARLFAVRALGRGGPAASIELARVLGGAESFTPAERAEAAKQLARLDRRGQRALADAIPGLAPPSDAVGLTGLVGDELGVLLSALDALSAPGSATKTLRALAGLAPPPGAPATIARRIAWIRCSAAKVLAGADFRDPLLLACDVTGAGAAGAASAGGTAGAGAAGAGAGLDGGTAAAPGADAGAPPGAASAGGGSIGARAVVDVLGRGELTGARLAAWRPYATGGDLRAREAALELIGAHDEIDGAAAVLATALGAKETGLVATAADVIAKHPQRAGEDAKPKRGAKGKSKRRSTAGDDAAEKTAIIGAPAPAVVKALLAALSTPAASEDLEMQSSLLDAAGALALKEATPKLEELCRSAYPTAREHAAEALGLVTGKKVTCDAPATGGEAPADLASLVTTATTLTFDTDVGPLAITLDPALAPVTATRMIDLARAGYFDGNVVHRVVAGFVTQFGAPHGDGYGGPDGKQPLRCETSPLPFAPLTVGVALAGRDTGSSQLFVMHARYPHLDGQYAWVGTASGAWASLVDGDVIRHVKVTP